VKEVGGFWRSGRTDSSQTAAQQVSGQGFDPHEVHGAHKKRKWKLHASSAATGWRNMFVSSQTEVREEVEYGTTRHDLLVVHRNGPARVVLKLGEQTTIKRVVAGGATLVPGGTDGFTVRVLDPIDSVHIYLRHEMIERIFDECSPTAMAYEPFFGLHDSLLEQLALASTSALGDTSTSSSFCVDHLAWTIGAHLIEIQRREWIGPGGLGLTDGRLKKVQQHMLDHLAGDLGVADLAGAAGLSPVYFARQFKLRTGSPPHRYLRSLRVKRAKELLCHDQLSIAEIALNCGFCHQEHMTKAFKADAG
jgi:AraC family transcriptional regulator